MPSAKFAERFQIKTVYDGINSKAGSFQELALFAQCNAVALHQSPGCNNHAKVSVAKDRAIMSAAER